MKKILLVSMLSFFIIIILSFQALAFRCGQDIVSRWDAGATAQLKCGNPFQIGSGTENIDGNIRGVEKQFYNCGENDFIYSISIYNGIIIRIESVERGKGKGQCQ
jgi:hypothetical protein